MFNCRNRVISFRKSSNDFLLRTGNYIEPSVRCQIMDNLLDIPNYYSHKFGLYLTTQQKSYTRTSPVQYIIHHVTVA